MATHTDNVIVLTPHDLIVLKDVIREVKNRRIPSPHVYVEQPSHQSPEFYLARPESSIPALVVKSRTGTATSSGTGTDSPDPPGEGDTPGSGTADIYQLRQSDGTMQKIAIHQTVYNISSSVLKDEWIEVNRDKFGTWWALTPGASSEIVNFTINFAHCGSTTGTGTSSITTGTGTGTGDETLDVTAMITNVVCGGNSNLIGTIIVPKDDDGCWLIGNCTLLVGLTGKAVFMAGAGNKPCYWSIISLPCVGETC